MSQVDSKQRAAISNSVPAPKNPAVWSSLRASAAASSATAMTAAIIPMSNGRLSDLRLSTPASRPRGVTGWRPRRVHAIEPRPVTIPAAAPMASDAIEAWSESSLVPTASIHQVRSPSMMNPPYASAAPIPTTAPGAARAAPSSRNIARSWGIEKPSARSTPISRMRCSTPSLKNSPVSKRAETIRKKLK